MKKLFLTVLVFGFCLGLLNNQVFAKEKIETIHDVAGIYIFKINTKKYGSKIKPYMPIKVETPLKAFNNNPYDLVVNASFFDVKTGKSVSDVTIDYKELCNIDNDTALVEQLKKQGRYEKVKNRAEFRILENKRGKLKFDIALKDGKIKKGYKIKHSLQAGPIIYPDMDLVKEGFVTYCDDTVQSQAVDILKRRERTMIGLKGKYLYIVLFTKDHKVDANEMRDFAKDELHLKKAMAFDGGLSTAITTRNLSIGSFGQYQRKVKSFLVIEK